MQESRFVMAKRNSSLDRPILNLNQRGRTGTLRAGANEWRGEEGKNSERWLYGSLALSRISRITKRPRGPLLIAGSARAIFPRRPHLTVHSNRRDRRPRTDRPRDARLALPLLHASVQFRRFPPVRSSLRARPIRSNNSRRRVISRIISGSKRVTAGIRGVNNAAFRGAALLQRRLTRLACDRRAYPASDSWIPLRALRRSFIRVQRRYLSEPIQLYLGGIAARSIARLHARRSSAR